MIYCNRIQYTQRGRFGCVPSKRVLICEISTSKITFVNVLFPTCLDPLAPYRTNWVKCKDRNLFLYFQTFRSKNVENYFSQGLWKGKERVGIRKIRKSANFLISLWCDRFHLSYFSSISASTPRSSAGTGWPPCTERFCTNSIAVSRFFFMPAKIVLFCLSAKFSPQNINKRKWASG